MGYKLTGKKVCKNQYFFADQFKPPKTNQSQIFLDSCIKVSNVPKKQAKMLNFTPQVSVQCQALGYGVLSLGHFLSQACNTLLGQA
jgi:hypothetical protein